VGQPIVDAVGKLQAWTLEEGLGSRMMDHLLRLKKESPVVVVQRYLLPLLAEFVWLRLRLGAVDEQCLGVPLVSCVEMHQVGSLRLWYFGNHDGELEVEKRCHRLLPE